MGMSLLLLIPWFRSVSVLDRVFGYTTSEDPLSGIVPHL